MTTSNGHSGSNGHGHGHSEAAQAQAKELGREQRELECALDDDELRVRGDDMASAELEVDELKLKRSGINGEIADLRAKCAKLAKAIDSRSETRMVACVWIEELQQNAKRLVRQDTGATIDTRSLEVAELQTTLDDIMGGASDIDSDADGVELALAVDDVTGEVLPLEAANDNGDGTLRAAVAPRKRVRTGPPTKDAKQPKNKAKQSGKKAAVKSKPSKHTRHIHA